MTPLSLEGGDRHRWTARRDTTSFLLESLFAFIIGPSFLHSFLPTSLGSKRHFNFVPFYAGFILAFPRGREGMLARGGPQSPLPSLLLHLRCHGPLEVCEGKIGHAYRCPLQGREGGRFILQCCVHPFLERACMQLDGEGRATHPSSVSLLVSQRNLWNDPVACCAFSLNHCGRVQCRGSGGD